MREDLSGVSFVISLRVIQKIKDLYGYERNRLEFLLLLKHVEFVRFLNKLYILGEKQEVNRSKARLYSKKSIQSN